jgi:outer membrane protein assembly factor BamD (BamD/ComL family)
MTMYHYRRNNRLGGGSVFFIVLFMLATGILAYFYITDTGRFWDILPIASIAIMGLSFIVFLFNLLRRISGSFIFFMFFLIFLAALVFSSLQGPFALYRQANKSVEANDLESASENLKAIIADYQGSRYYEEALLMIPYIYNDLGDPEEAVYFFELAGEEGLIDMDELEVNIILSDSYISLAESSGEPGIRAENYLAAASYLKNVVERYPESNEAFVSYYKIPSYYYEAAAIYRDNEEFQESIDLLNEILEEYPQSDVIEQSNQLLFRNHIERSQKSASEFNYLEALQDYAVAQEIASENNMDGLIEYYSGLILKDISVDILKNYAQSLFNENQYSRALFIYENILQNNPELSEEINPFIAQSKVKMISQSRYQGFDEIAEARIWSPENFTFILVNRSQVPLSFYIGRPGAQSIDLGPNERIDLTREAGRYEIAIEPVGANGILPLYGSIGFEENTRYTFTFDYQIEEE